MFNAQYASAFATLGIPAFAGTPDAFPDLIAAALQRRDLGTMAAARDVQTSR